MKQYIPLIFISSLLLFFLTFGCSPSHSKRTHRNSNKYIFKDPLDVKRSSRWSLVPMEGQRLASERQNWLIIDFTYYGHSNLFGMAGSDNVSDNISDNSIEAVSSVRAIERKVRTDENVIEEKKKKEQTHSE